ncbi:MAG: MogA/MoaB family molybdenum cofactor biosynthesis protein [Thermovirgaceae bacterium]
MKHRILGFSEGADKTAKTPVAFFHTDARGQPCANGCQRRILIVPPGSCGGDDDAFTIILSKSLFPLPGHGFLRFAKDGVLLECKTHQNGEIRCEVFRPGFVTVSEVVEFWPPIKTGIMTISDKGSRGEREDTSGPALAKAIADIGGIVCKRAVVPDEKEEIATLLETWTTGADPLDLLLTTGGTGLSERDVTPEALGSLSGKDVPGLAEFMRWKTSFFTLRSILSRGMAKVVGRTLVVALPGSRRGAIQCFEAVSPVLRHAVDIASGKGGECGGHHS